jgi:hypothetical protein
MCIFNKCPHLGCEQCTLLVVFLSDQLVADCTKSYGIFLAHYLANNTFPGATALDYAFVGGLSISMALIISPIATICTRKFGTQISLLIGVLFETAGLLGASFAREIWHLFLSQGLAFGFVRMVVLLEFCASLYKHPSLLSCPLDLNFVAKY